MTDHKTTLPLRTLKRVRALLALAVLALSLTMVAPAAAWFNIPIGPDGKKACPYKGPFGVILWMPNGTVVTADTGDTYKCIDGAWVKLRGSRG